jgi:transposase
LKSLDGGVWKTRIAEPKQPGFSRWHGDDKARVAVYANRTRLGSRAGRQAMRRRAEIVERSFAHNLDRGGMRRSWLRRRKNVHKRYLVHVAGHNLGILMRLLIGAGTRERRLHVRWPICVSSAPRRPPRSSLSPRPATGLPSWS